MKHASYRFQICTDPPPDETAANNKNKWMDVGTSSDNASIIVNSTDDSPLKAGNNMWARVALFSPRKKKEDSRCGYCRVI